jgi:hypothetical protein
MAVGGGILGEEASTGGASSGLRSAPRFEDHRLLDDVVEKLSELERRGGIERTLAIGELILSRFFAGEALAWRDRRRNKNNSIRRLADRQDCPLSRSALNEAVAVYVASRALPCVRTFGHIDASHIACVLRLPENQRQAMLEHAEHDRLSVRELRRQVVYARRRDGERRGRPADGAEARALRLLEEASRRASDAGEELNAVAELDTTTRARVRELAMKLVKTGSLLLELERAANRSDARVQGSALHCP